MTYPKPGFTRKGVRLAGTWLADDAADPLDTRRGMEILTNWRAAHGYPLNTFQATLRNKLARIDKKAIVGQRLKRAPSVIAKLKRFHTMELPQMQDLAGLRAIVDTMPKLHRLHEHYLSSRFAHELVKTHNYVETPKVDGYRSIHLIYKYKNDLVPEYNGQFVELQMRTKLQHAWATAVETVDAYLGEAIKAGRPGAEWAEFFKLASAGFSHLEKSPWLDEYKGVDLADLLERLSHMERKLNVMLKLKGFRVATARIEQGGRATSGYHLVILNLPERRLSIHSYSITDQEAANAAYAAIEARAQAGEPIDPVLITGGKVDTLRKSFPNYFLDTDVFVEQLENLLALRLVEQNQ